jgi:hypothetical protein
MKFSSNALVLLAFASLIFSSCKEKGKEQIIEEADQPTKVSVQFHPMWQDEAFQMEGVYYDNFGNRIRVDKFMHYMSNLELTNEAGDDILLKDFYLMDFFNENKMEFEIPAGNYKKLKFGIGVPEAYNKDQDPSQYANSHPLSVAGSQGMFWTWNTGYIFLKFEGKADTTGVDGNELLWPVAIHVGDDPFYSRFSSPTMVINVEQGKTKTLHVNIHVDEILAAGAASELDFATDAITHTSNNLELAEAFMTNYINAITVEQ